MDLTNQQLIYGVALLVIVLGLIISVYVYTRPRQAKSLPVSQSPYYIQGLLALLDGQSKKAFESLRKEVESNARNFDAYLRLGNLFRDVGQYEKALQVHYQLTARQDLPDKERLELHESLARDYKGLERHAKVVEHLLNVLEMDAHNLNAMTELFREYEILEQYDDAFEMLKRIHKLEAREQPDLLAIYLAHVGRIQAQRGEIKQAMSNFKQATKYDKACTPAYLYWGDMLDEQGETKQAVDVWTKIVDNRPQDGYLLFDRIDRALFDIGKFDRVVSIYEQLQDANPEDTRYMIALARVYLRQDQTSDALNLVKMALEHDPNDRNALLLSIYIHNELGDVTTMSEQLTHAVKIEKAVPERYQCGNCGHTSDLPLWYCPVCRHWKTYLNGAA